MGRRKHVPLVWRLETAEGEGVYQSPEFMPDESPYRDGSNPKRPGPKPDGIPGTYAPKLIGGWFPVRGTGGFFGFVSIEQARAWFDRPEDIREWSHRGLFLAAYHGADIRQPFVTPHQVAFYKDEDATPRRWPASALYDLEADTLERQAKEAFKHAHV